MMKIFLAYVGGIMAVVIPITLYRHADPDMSVMTSVGHWLLIWAGISVWRYLGEKYLD